ncbi:hypothetical protein QFC22_003321 [Naganishia vaughanmartiniae]|uniref:Uncharacterized protein n=1 Tax=Naganishia vaughanmartiniae TaxID=1424756 RepID=A0ACC2XA02_9TREE|nr:hypothetical protein QFC22_003321 [Naganishia vaughanmartiniae]
MNQPMDAFLCFDVEATCVADKLIDWPNEIIEFPVILLGWADEEEEEDTNRVDDELDNEASTVSSERSPSPEHDQVGSNHTQEEKRDTDTGEERTRENVQSRAVRDPSERPGERTAQTEASTATTPNSDTSISKESGETAAQPELNCQAGRLPGKKLVVVDKFHSYVRPMWQPKLTKFCTGLTGIQQDTIDSAPTFPEVIKLLEQWLEGHDLLVGGKLRDKACWCTDGPWDLRDFLPKQLHITPLKPDPYPAYLRGPVLNVKDACHYVLSDLWYTSELEKSAVQEARYRATLDETRRKADEARLKSANSATDGQKIPITRPPPPESQVQKRLRNRPRLCSTGSWALSPKGMKMPKFQLTITGQLAALDLGEFQGQQHSGIDDAMNIARVVIELARRNVLLDINEKPYQPQRFSWMGRPGQVFWNAKVPLE